MQLSEPQTFLDRKSDEISVKMLIIRTRAYLQFLGRFWYLIFLAAFPLAFKNYTDLSKILPTYNAKTTLLIKTQTTMKDNAIISQIFARLANARKVISSVLLSPTEIDGKEDLLFNHYIRIYQKTYPDLFEPTVEEGFRLSKTDPSTFNRNELLVFDFILDKITTPLKDFSDGFVTISNEEKLGFININISTPDENLSLRFNELLFEELDFLYRENVLYADKDGIRYLTNKADSIKTVFDKTFSYLLKKRNQFERLIKSRDSTANLSYRAQQIEKLEVEVAFLKEDFLDYGEKIKDAELEANNNAPLIMIVEQSLPPLDPFRPSQIVSAIKGAIIGIGLMIFILIAWKMYKDLIKEFDSSQAPVT